MNAFDSEQDQVEAFKKWWKENGVAVVMGLVIGVGGLVGWRSWTTYVENRGASGSVLYEELHGRAAAGDAAGALDVADHLAAEYDGTAYADLSRLTTARLRYAEGDVAGAIAALQAVRDAAELEVLRDVAALRLARLHLDQGDLDQAEAALAAVPPEAFTAVRAELQGDILLARGDTAAARGAYREALAATATDAGRALLQMKLDDLGPGAGATS